MSILWGPVPAWPYEVSNEGQVRNVRSGHVLRQQLHKSGYLNVQLWRGGEHWTVGVHQLMALAFLGPLPSEKHEVRHGDGNATRNILSNLSYGLHVDNMRDRDRHGTTAKGERNGKIKHPDSLVAEARAARARGLSFVQIGHLLGVHHATVFGWLSGRTRS